MMRLRAALKLDHFAAPASASPAGVALLVGGLAAAVVMTSWHERAARELRRAEADQLRARNLVPARTQRAVEDPRRLQEAVKRANGVARQIAMPWAEVFAAVEAASVKDVALLSVQPDPQRGALRLGAEARDTAAMLAYLHALQASPGLGRVALETHSVLQGGARRPVQFTLVANWVGLP